MARPIPSTESTPITTPEDFQRYALHVATDPKISGGLAARLLELAAAGVRW